MTPASTASQSGDYERPTHTEGVRPDFPSPALAFRDGCTCSVASIRCVHLDGLVLTLVWRDIVETQGHKTGLPCAYRVSLYRADEPVNCAECGSRDVLRVCINTDDCTEAEMVFDAEEAGLRLGVPA